MSISFPENLFERKILVPDLSMSSLLICMLNMVSLQFQGLPTSAEDLLKTRQCALKTPVVFEIKWM